MMKLKTNSPAPDFLAETISGDRFRLSDLKGRKILLSFFRNGACALCNLRVHELIMEYPGLRSKGLQIVAVFESPKEDMLPYVGRQDPPFPLLSDPEGKIYELYGVESSPEVIQQIQEQGLAENRITAAIQQGFDLIPQEGSNFFRLPADFLINEALIIEKAKYKNAEDFAHISLKEIEYFLTSETHS